MLLLTAWTGMALAARCISEGLFGVPSRGTVPENVVLFQTWGEDGDARGFGGVPVERFLLAEDGSVIRLEEVGTARPGSPYSTYTPGSRLTPGSCYALLVVPAGTDPRLSRDEPWPYWCVSEGLDRRPPTLGALRLTLWNPPDDSASDRDDAGSGGVLFAAFGASSDDLSAVAVYRLAGAGRSPMAVALARADRRWGHTWFRLPTDVECSASPPVQAASAQGGGDIRLRLDPYDWAGNRGRSVYLDILFTGDETTPRVIVVGERRSPRPEGARPSLATGQGGNP